MALPVVKQCCCGCSLEVGSKIIAWLQIVGGVFMIIAGIVAVVAGGSESSEHPSAYDGSSKLVSGILGLIFGIVLLIGIQKKCPGHISAWVIITLIGIVLDIIGSIVSVYLLMVAGAIPVGLIAIVLSAITVALTFYFVVVVSSLRKEIVASGKIGV